MSLEPTVVPSPSPADSTTAATSAPGSGDRAELDRIRALGDVVAELGQRPLAEHAESYERVHSELRAALGAIDGA